MTSIIYVVIAILFLVLIAWTWNVLGEIEKSKKIAYIVISLIIMMLITFLIATISEMGIKYENEEMKVPVRNLLLAVFTPINGFIVIQYIAKILGNINAGTIDEEKAKKKFAIIFIIFLIVAIIECAYMKNIQGGIISMYNNLKL